ncbi:MAG: hypothetical protein PUG74_00250 [Prevotellaceae bacterium]|nr:hypothetical protein [Prevotellaceae bacterium]
MKKKTQKMLDEMEQILHSLKSEGEIDDFYLMTGVDGCYSHSWGMHVRAGVAIYSMIIRSLCKEPGQDKDDIKDVFWKLEDLATESKGSLEDFE